MKGKLNLVCIAVAACLLVQCTETLDVNEHNNTVLKSETADEAEAITSVQSSESGILIDNNAIWYDTNGDYILAQGGGIIQVGDVFHWFGPAFDSTTNFRAVNHYSSTDLKHWTKHAPAFTPSTPGIPFKSYNWVGRQWVMWNPNTNLYVMACEWGNGNRVQYAFFTSPGLEGPWTYHADKLIQRRPDVNNVLYTMGDLGVYTEGNEAWLLYTFDKPEANYSQAMVKLDTDFMTPLPNSPETYVEFTNNTWPTGVREAAAILKRGSTYYYFTSQCLGWRSSETRYRTAPAMSGPWTPNAAVMTSPSSSNSFQTQHDFILPITGSEGTTYIYCGDRWNNFIDMEEEGRYAWFPISFNTSGVPVINAPHYHSNGGDWLLDLAKGTWSVPDGDEQVSLKNGGFEENFADWTTSGNASIATATAEVHSGTKAVKSWATSAYTTAIENASTTNCPAGTYAATVWSRAGGTFNRREFAVFVNDVKVKSLALPMTTTWTAYTITGIDVPEGATVKVSITLDAGARAWTQFDDFSIVRN